jgi:DNA recombination protein RmuC
MSLVVVLLVVGLVAMLAVTAWALMRPAQVLAQTHMELRSLGDRVGSIENSQGRLTTELSGSTSALQTELSRAIERLTELRTQAVERAGTDRQIADSVRRLETVIAGTQSKGAAGENILEVVFSKLPPEWQVRNVRIDNRVVEFAIRLPNGRLLPIDSKWVATDLIERLALTSEPNERRAIRTQIEAIVRLKAREVQKYLDPDYTINFGIAALPDAVYDACYSMHSECFQSNVVLVAYSMIVPYLLLVFQMTLGMSQHIDMERLAAFLSSAEDGMKKAQAELEGRHANALKMLGNSEADLSKQLSAVTHALQSIHIDGEPDLIQVDDVPALPLAPSS